MWTGACKQRGMDGQFACSTSVVLGDVNTLNGGIFSLVHLILLQGEAMEMVMPHS